MGPAGGDVMSGCLEWAGGVWNSDDDELLSKFVSLGVCSLIIITHWVGEYAMEVSSCVGVTDGEGNSDADSCVSNCSCDGCSCAMGT